MKPIQAFSIILAVSWGLLGLAAESVPTAPTELKLTSGATLRDVRVVRFEGSDRVLVKHLGGTDPIRLTYIAEPWRAKLLAYRAIWEDAKAKQAAVVDPPRIITGQVFVTTRGRGGYKFAGTVVSAYRTEEMKALVKKQRSALPLYYTRLIHDFEKEKANYEAWQKVLQENAPEIIAEAATDAEGNYRLELPAKAPAITLVCTAMRLAGYSDEYNVWVVGLPAEMRRLDLNGLNQWQQPE